MSPLTYIYILCVQDVTCDNAQVQKLMTTMPSVHICLTNRVAIMAKKNQE